MKQKDIDKLTLAERVSMPTPTLFTRIRNIGLILAAVSGAVLAAPVALPAVVTTIAGYLALASSVASAVSQVAVKG
ncbi:hypothetical protein [Flavihumibacter solisilvae]|uniref:Uncharacterized protein n=1 Tax=Flavihumibacter solisilvae TaxID=1349421 RepID=A0A0C1L517_9BACT|nr:hypothetical protein [Flavihumibacter solisilvae]KIC94646.1 hypothetical protein OI18_11205 [Flavihumibacter solisilvae]